MLMYKRVQDAIEKGVNELLESGADSKADFTIYASPDLWEEPYEKSLDEEGHYKAGTYGSEFGVVCSVKLVPEMTTMQVLLLYEGVIQRSNWQWVSL
jgi:hypothetical protein